MSRDVEDLLAAELEQVAVEVRPPGVDLTGVRRLAHRERRRGRALVAAGVAAVLVLVVAGVVAWPGSRGVEVAGTSGADLIGLPWVDGDGVLHLPSGEEVSVAGASTVVSRGGTTVAVRARQLVQVEPGGLRPLVDFTGDTRDIRPVVSPDGRWVAWGQDASMYRVSLASGHVETIPLSGVFGPVDVGVDGRVLMGGSRAGDVLSLWPAPVGVEVTVRAAVRITSGSLLPLGRIVSYTDKDQVPRIYQLNDDGTTAPVAQLAAGFAPLASDLSAYVGVTDDFRLGVRTLDADLNAGPVVPLDLPGGPSWAPMEWNPADRLVLVDEADLGSGGAGTDVQVCEKDGSCRAVDEPSLAYVVTP